jgi:hypothetical protein
MTHPFALSIDDLQTLELLDGESDHADEVLGGAIGHLPNIPEAKGSNGNLEGGGWRPWGPIDLYQHLAYDGPSPVLHFTGIVH